MMAMHMLLSSNWLWGHQRLFFVVNLCVYTLIIQFLRDADGPNIENYLIFHHQIEKINLPESLGSSSCKDVEGRDSLGTMLTEHTFTRRPKPFRFIQSSHLLVIISTKSHHLWNNRRQKIIYFIFGIKQS